MGDQLSPNVYTEYYVETEGDGKNLFILELENEELVFAETDRRMAGSREDSQSWGSDFAELQRDLFGGQGKLSNDDLKKLFAKFFGIDEMRDFALEFMGSKASKGSEELKDLALGLLGYKGKEEEA